MKINHKKILSEMRRQRRYPAEIARQMGESRQTVYYHMKKDKAQTMKTVRFWAKVLKLRIKDLLLK